MSDGVAGGRRAPSVAGPSMRRRRPVPLTTSGRSMATVWMRQAQDAARQRARREHAHASSEGVGHELPEQTGPEKPHGDGARYDPRSP
jgi:hypothetical protein